MAATQRLLHSTDVGVAQRRTRATLATPKVPWFRWVSLGERHHGRDISGIPYRAGAHRKTHRTTGHRRDVATRNGTSACAVATGTGNLRG